MEKIINCPALDYYIKTSECDGCECKSDCDSKPIERPNYEMDLIWIYNSLFPNACYEYSKETVIRMVKKINNLNKQ